MEIPAPRASVRLDGAETCADELVGQLASFEQINFNPA
jgi:hypothetical protein